MPQGGWKTHFNNFRVNNVGNLLVIFTKTMFTKITMFKIPQRICVAQLEPSRLMLAGVISHVGVLYPPAIAISSYLCRVRSSYVIGFQPEYISNKYTVSSCTLFSFREKGKYPADKKIISIKIDELDTITCGLPL